MQKIKILIVDDHKMIRSGLRSMLEQNPEKYNCEVEEASSGKEAIEKIRSSYYHIILMDYRMPVMNGAEATKEIIAYNPNANVIGLSNYDESVCIEEIMQAGAKGYMLKNIDSPELTEAITAVLNGELYFSGDISKKLGKEASAAPSGQQLTERELLVLKLIPRCYTSRRIASELLLSKHTIDKYRKRLLKKMEVKNTPDLLVKARSLNLIN